MSFSSDVKQAVRDELSAISRAIDDERASDLIYETERNLSTDALNKAVEPAVFLNDRRAEKLHNDQDRYDDMVEELGQVIAESIAYENLKSEKLLRAISREMEDDFKASVAKFIDWVDDYDDSDRGRDRGRDRRRDKGRDRDDRDDRDSRRRGRSSRKDRDCDRSRKDGRHVNSYERDDDPEEAYEREDRHTGRSTPKREEAKVEVKSKLYDGDIITRHNFSNLPDNCKDIPFFYAGLENLIYREDPDKVVLNLLEGNFQVNYEQHRTDVFLAKNRDLDQNTPVSLDKLHKQMLMAAKDKIEAFVETSTSTEENPVYDTNSFPLEKSTIIKGVYELPDTRVVDSEYAVRQILVDMFGDKFNSQVVGVSVKHSLYKASNSQVQTKDWAEFSSLAFSMSVQMRFNEVKTLLEYAQKFFDTQAYYDYHKIVNAAVCNALSCSMKLGIKSNSILNDWNEIIELIEETAKTKPWIVGLIATNLMAALPTIIFEEENVYLLRNYIYLPISLNEFTVASPIDYATINKSVRPEMYEVIDKLLTTNIPAECYKPLTTLVTLENESLNVVHNRDLITDSGYYVFKPIK